MADDNKPSLFLHLPEVAGLAYDVGRQLLDDIHASFNGTTSPLERATQRRTDAEDIIRAGGSAADVIKHNIELDAVFKADDEQSFSSRVGAQIKGALPSLDFFNLFSNSFGDAKKTLDKANEDNFRSWIPIIIIGLVVLAIFIILVKD